MSKRMVFERIKRPGKVYLSDEELSRRLEEAAKASLMREPRPRKDKRSKPELRAEAEEAFKAWQGKR
jgi:hypothetical protein